MRFSFKCPRVVVLATLLATFMLEMIPRVSEGAMITYISSTRYIEGNGIPREDAVGFSDFDVSRGAFVGVPNAGVMYARVEAAQTSRLLSDRIEVSASTLTQFIQNPQGNSIAAASSFDVTFSVDESTQVTLSAGPIFFQSSGGSAGVALLDSGGNAVLAATGSPLEPTQQTALIQPGTYRFVGGAASGSLQRNAGPAQTIATLTVPPVSAFGAMSGGVALAGLRRPRR